MTIVSGETWEKNCFWSGQEFFGEYRYATNEELIGKFDITIVVFLFVEQKKEFGPKDSREYRIFVHLKQSALCKN